MTLHKQQTELLAAIFSQQSYDEVKDDTAISLRQIAPNGLKIYQQSLLANAVRALTTTFATLASFIGERTFTTLVKAYLQKELKAQYDWGECGASFSAFIAQSSVANAALYSELAALDFACHQCQRSEDQAQNLDSLTLFASNDAYQLSVVLSAGAALFTSSFPLDEIISKVEQLSTEQKDITLVDIELVLTDFSEKYQQQIPTNYNFVIWRPAFIAQYAQIEAAEFQWLKLWLKTSSIEKPSIGQALDQMKTENFSIVDWLPKAIEMQILSEIKLI
jgi:hypothetical protein